MPSSVLRKDCFFHSFDSARSKCLRFLGRLKNPWTCCHPVHAVRITQPPPNNMMSCHLELTWIRLWMIRTLYSDPSPCRIGKSQIRSQDLPPPAPKIYSMYLTSNHIIEYGKNSFIRLEGSLMFLWLQSTIRHSTSSSWNQVIAYTRSSTIRHTTSWVRILYVPPLKLD